MSKRFIPFVNIVDKTGNNYNVRNDLAMATLLVKPKQQRKLSLGNHKASKGQLEGLMDMAILETERLIIRPFTMADMERVYQILDVELGETDLGYESAKARGEREQWLRWTIMSYGELARLYQPPYGDRAVSLRQTDQLIGVCGYVLCLGPFGQLPSPHASTEATGVDLYTTELGLFYAFSPAFQGQGYATEAARAMVDYAFRQLHLKRVVATTTYENVASIRVMENLGMRIEKNPYPDPPWFQVIGILDHR